jgi:hypothetical protein
MRPADGTILIEADVDPVSIRTTSSCFFLLLCFLLCFLVLATQQNSLLGSRARLGRQADLALQCLRVVDGRLSFALT